MATGLCFVALAVTGTVLFVTPPGRVAYWTNWRLLGLGKDQWASLHIWFSLSFLILSGVHIWLNWRSLLGYFKSRVTHHFALRREWMLASVLCAVVVAGSLVEIPPFSTLITWNETIKGSWEKSDEQAPIPHAELLSLEELSSKVGVDLDTVMARLEAKGIVIESSESTVRELADEHGLSPLQLYNIAIGERRPAGNGRSTHGRGMGRKTLRQVCADEGLDLTIAIEKLRAADVEADADERIREIATRTGLRPSELLDILRESP